MQNLQDFFDAMHQSVDAMHQATKAFLLWFLTSPDVFHACIYLAIVGSVLTFAFFVALLADMPTDVSTDPQAPIESQIGTRIIITNVPRASGARWKFPRLTRAQRWAL